MGLWVIFQPSGTQDLVASPMVVPAMLVDADDERDAVELVATTGHFLPGIITVASIEDRVVFDLTLSPDLEDREPYPYNPQS